MFKMHRWLNDSVKSPDSIFWGKIIVGVSTIFFIFILITGIIIWFPKTKKALENRLKIHTRKGWFRFWYYLHVSGGFYVTIFLLIMGFTGLTWSFQWYREGFYGIFGVEMTSPHGQAPQQAQRPETAKNENTQTRNEERKEISSSEKDAQSERAERGNRPEGAERSGRPEIGRASCRERVLRIV